MIITKINRKNKIEGLWFVSTCVSLTVQCCNKNVDIDLSKQPELHEKAKFQKCYIGCSCCYDKLEVSYHIVKNIKFPLRDMGTYWRSFMGSYWDLF